VILFIICAKILANQIRFNKNTKGITVHNIEKKISQLTDDTSLILAASKKSLVETLETLILAASKKSLVETLETIFRNVWSTY
jgi:hypothetical protein